MASGVRAVTVLVCGDARSLPLHDATVQCVVTSPPYWGLRDYGLPPGVWGGDATCQHEWSHAPRGWGGGPQGKTGQRADRTFTAHGSPVVVGSCAHCSAWLGVLGLEPTPDLYIQHLVETFREVKRVLRDDGTVWLNLGDCYHAGNRGGYDRTRVGVSKNTGAAASDFLAAPNRLPQVGLKPKDLVGIPWRVAFALQADGATSPETMERVGRLLAAITDSYESREEWPDRIRQEVERLECEWTDAHRGAWYLRSDIVWAKPNPMPESVRDRPTRSHEYLFLLSKSERYYYDYRAISEPLAASSAKRTSAQLLRRNARSVWFIPTQPYRGAHFATFPEKLVEPCVLAGCPEGGVVLDPFCGSGTVGVVAARHGRKFVGVELKPDYIRLAQERIG